MKYLITFLMLLNYGYAQTLTSNPAPHSGMAMGWRNDSVEILKWVDGFIEIKGDTMAAIRLLFKSKDAQNEELTEAWQTAGRFMRRCDQLIKLNKDIIKAAEDYRKIIGQLQKVGSLNTDVINQQAAMLQSINRSLMSVQKQLK